MKLKYFIPLILLSACGKAPDVNVSNNQALQVDITQCTQNDFPGHRAWRYVYSEAHDSYKCSTKCQTFYTKKDYCAALQDDYLNGYCAKDSRQEAFARENCKEARNE